MPKNSDLIHRTYEAWNREDREAWLETHHPDVELHTAGAMPDLDPVYRGHEGLVEFWRRIHDPWEEHRIAIEQIAEEGDCCLARVRFHAKGVDSGVDVEMQFAHAIRVRDWLIVEVVNRPTVDEAREAIQKG